MDPQRQMLLTSNGLTSPALNNEFERLVGSLGPPSTAHNVWYLPTGGGMSIGFPPNALQRFRRQHRLGEVRSIDVAHFVGKEFELRRIVQELAPRIVYVEQIKPTSLERPPDASGTGPLGGTLGRVRRGWLSVSMSLSQSMSRHAPRVASLLDRAPLEHEAR